MGDELAWHIERERRVLLLLAKNQSARQHIVAAGRHLEELGRLLRLRERLAGAIAPPLSLRDRREITMEQYAALDKEHDARCAQLESPLEQAAS